MTVRNVTHRGKLEILLLQAILPFGRANVGLQRWRRIECKPKFCHVCVVVENEATLFGSWGGRVGKPEQDNVVCARTFGGPHANAENHAVHREEEK